MATSKKIASKAANQLKSKKSTKNQKSVAGSDLSQAKKPNQKNKIIVKKKEAKSKPRGGGGAE